MTQKEFISVCDLNKANVKCIDSFREREKKKMKDVGFGNWEEKKRCKEQGANKLITL